MKCKQCKKDKAENEDNFYKTGKTETGETVLDKKCIDCRTLNQRRRYAVLRERKEREAAKTRRRIDHDRVVFIHALATGLVTIVVTDNIRRTLIYLRDLNADRLVVLFSVPGGEMRLSQIHGDLAGRRVHGEWYNPDAEFWYYVDDLKRRRVN